MTIERKTSDGDARQNDAPAETVHLLRSPRNAERLFAAIADAESGRVVHAVLDDGAIAELPRAGKDVQPPSRCQP